MSSTPGGIKGLTFEEQLAELEGIVERLERGELSLEDSVQLFEKGLRLSNACKQQLEAAEGKIQVLIDKGAGVAEVGDLAAEPPLPDGEDAELGES